MIMLGPGSRLPGANSPVNYSRFIFLSLCALASMTIVFIVLSDPNRATYLERPQFKIPDSLNKVKNLFRKPKAGLPQYWSTSNDAILDGVTDFVRPEGLRIVGLVFYGRPASVSILDCYLKRNLIENGGILDEVIFLARTQVEEDLQWLDQLVTTSPRYRRHDLAFNVNDFSSAYDVCQPGVMYVKIDDDIVFVEDMAIPTIVKTKLEHPEYFTVSANVMNQPSLSWIHKHLGVVKPYLPELSPPGPAPQNQSRWKASQLPIWEGPEDLIFRGNFEPPFMGHRWLPAPKMSSIDQTPIATTEYDAFSPGLWFWTVAAQEHYSFFEHLENNELWKYKFNLWDYNYQRMGIQFIAISGDDIVTSRPVHRDDEYYFTEARPIQTGRHAVVDGKALVAHYSFGPQKTGIQATDILSRYAAFAQENICPDANRHNSPR